MDPATIALLVRVLAPIVLQELPALLPVAIKILTALHEHSLTGALPGQAAEAVAKQIERDGYFMRDDTPGA